MAGNETSSRQALDSDCTLLIAACSSHRAKKFDFAPDNLVRGRACSMIVEVGDS